jgi:hypothetical protein
MRKFSFKIMVLVLTLAAAAAVFSGCGTVQLEKPKALEGVPTFPVTGSCEIAIKGNVINVSGETDLMDGTFINISVVAQNGMTLDSATIVKSGNSISSDFALTDKYEGVKKIKGYITCAPTLYGKQPDNVYKNYGNTFEYIETDKENYIWEKDGIIILFGSDMVDLLK